MSTGGVTALRWEDVDGNTVHEFSPSHGRWSGFLTKHGLTGRTAPRSDEMVQSRGRSPEPAGAQFGERPWTVDYLISADNPADHNSYLAELKGEIREMEDRKYWLVYEEAGITKMVAGVPGAVNESPDGLKRDHYRATITITGTKSYSYSSDTSATGTLNSDTGLMAVTNDGQLSSDKAIVKLTPTGQKAAADGQRFGKRLFILNRSDAGLADWAVELTADELIAKTGWDTAAKVAAGDMRSDGFDVRLIIDGIEYARWDYDEAARGWNRSNTNAWSAPPIPSKRTWTLARDVSSTDTTLPVVEQDAQPVKTPTTLIFNSGPNTEIMTATAHSVNDKEFTVDRGQHGTSAVRLAKGTKIWWCPREVWLVWGWTSASEPMIDDRQKPMCLASTNLSTNRVHYFDHLLENRTLGDILSILPRPESFKPLDDPDQFSHERERHDGKGELYTRYGAYTGAGLTNTNPATHLSLLYTKFGPRGANPYANTWEWRSRVRVRRFGYSYDASSLTMQAPNEGRGEVYAIPWIGKSKQKLAEYCAAGCSKAQGIAEHVFEGVEAGIRGVRFAVHIWTPTPDAGGNQNLFPQEPSDGDGFIVTDFWAEFREDEYPLVFHGPETNVYQIGRWDDPAELTDGDGRKVYIHGPVIGVNDTLHIDLGTGEMKLSDESRYFGHLTRIEGHWPRIPVGSSNLVLQDTGQTSLDYEVEVWDAWA